MNRRALCICCSGAKTATRCGRLYSNHRVAFGGWLQSQQFCHSSAALQSVGEDVEKGSKQAQHSDSVPETFQDVWQKEFQDLVNARPEEARNIFVEDLSATLEAHRAANRASVVRRLNQKANWKTPWKTLKDSSRIDEESLPTETAPTSSKDQNANTDGNAAEVSAGQCVLEPEDVALKKRMLRKSSRKGTGRDEKTAEKQTFQVRRMDLSQRRLHWPADSVQNRQITGKKYHHGTSGPLEYEAMYIGPVGEFDTKRWRTRDYPWLARLGTYVPAGRNGSALQRLNDELKAYEKYMRLGPIEREAADIFTADVTSLVHKVLPNSPVLPIGSYSTGLADRLSDFDFSISLPDLDKAPLERGPSPTRPKACKIQAKALLNTRISLAKSFQFIQPVEMIYARVPIVKAIHRITRFRVELQVLGSHEAAQEFTMAYLAEFPTLRPLYIVFRSALHIRRLNIVHEGGLGSYSILMMIVNALKHASGRFAQDDLANHFLHVLEFYSNADLYKNGFSPDPPRTFPKQAKLSSDEKIARLRDPVLRGIDILLKANPKKPYLLCLQDPANPVNDLGSKAYGIKHVQKLFGAIREGLKINMAAWEGDGNFQKAWQPHALLAEFLGAKYAGLEEQRRQVEQWVKQRNDMYTIKGWRQLAHPNEEPNGQLKLPRHIDLSSEDVRSVAGMTAANEQLEVGIDEGLDGTGLNIESVRSEGETGSEATMKPTSEADTSADLSVTHGQPSHQEARPPTTSLPKRDAMTQLTQRSMHSGSTKGDWKKWLPPTEDVLGHTEEQPSDTKEHFFLSPLLQENVKVQLRKDSWCSDTKTSSWKKWSPPTKDELTEQPTPSEPTPQSKSDQVDSQVKADQDLKEISTHRGSPMSHLRSMALRLSHGCQSIRRLSILYRPVLHRRRQKFNEVQARKLSKDKAKVYRKRKVRAQPLRPGKSSDPIVVSPKWWSKHLRSPPDRRMWYGFPIELEKLRMDKYFVKKINRMEWSELANSLNRSRLESICGREGGDQALVITVLIIHHARSALWRFQPKVLKHKIRKRFEYGSLIPGFDNPRGQAALSAAKASSSMPKSKDTGDIDQEEGSEQGGLAATSRTETTEVNCSKDTFLENDGGRPDREKMMYAADTGYKSLALGRSRSIKHKRTQSSNIDEDHLEQSETAGSGLPTDYEAPMPILDYFNKRKRALRTTSGHAAKSEKAVSPITHESARPKVSQPPVSKEQYWPSKAEPRNDEAIKSFHNALDVLMPTEEAKANLLVAIKSMSQKLKPGHFLKIETKNSSKGSPLKWYNHVRLVKGLKFDGEQIESSVDGDLAISNRSVLLDDGLTGQLVKERTSLDSLKAGSETTSEQNSILYGSYSRRRRKALLQIQAKKTQLWYPVVSSPKKEDAGHGTDQPGEQQDIKDMKTTAESGHRDRVSGKCFRVFASDKAPHLRSEFRNSGASNLTQETSTDASRMAEPRSDAGPAPEFWAKYEALEKLKEERGWGKYRDPNAVIEPLLEDQKQSSPFQAPLMNAKSEFKDDDLTGTAKFFHRKLSIPKVQPKQIFVDNALVTEKLNPEAHLSMEEQYRTSQRVADDEWIQTLQPTGHIAPPPSPSLPPKDSKKPSKQAKRKARYRALARRTEARRAAQLLQKAKKLAKFEKQREIQSKYTALREKLRKERRGQLVGDREIQEGIEEEKRGGVKWIGEM